MPRRIRNKKSFVAWAIPAYPPHVRCREVFRGRRFAFISSLTFSEKYRKESLRREEGVEGRKAVFIGTRRSETERKRERGSGETGIETGVRHKVSTCMLKLQIWICGGLQYWRLIVLPSISLLMQKETEMGHSAFTLADAAGA